jgi:hypothetical protein
MQRLIDRSTVPPDGFRFLQPETRIWITGGDFNDLLLNVRKHRLANNIPLGPVWEAQVEDQLCKMLPAGICKEQTPGVLPVNVSTRLSWGDIERGAQSFVNWAIAGAPTVSPVLANARAAICAGCYYNVGEGGGCRSCGSAVSMVRKAVGTKRTSSDAYLRMCAVCKCVNAIQVWFPAEQLAMTTTGAQMQQFPDFCWKKNELAALQQKETANATA